MVGMKQILGFFLILMGAAACSAQSGSVTGEWRGIWTNPAGTVYSAEMTLEAGPSCKTCAVIGSSAIRGKIVWTLRKTGPNAPPELAFQVDMTTTELVKGEMKGAGLLVLDGYQIDDPKGVKPLDKYRLALSDNGKVLGGITLNGGSWTGQLIAMRAQ
jgi:hypothetical protein